MKIAVLNDSFSSVHSLGYSTIGVQEGELYCDYPSIYWATSCLISDSGTDENMENKNQDYGKIANAIYNILSYGIKVSPPDINESDFGFTPIEKENNIVFGIKGITSINDELSKKIIENRPYSSFNEFEEKIAPTKIQAINLIKSGAFDNLCKIPRIELMKKYVSHICRKDIPVKEKLTTANIPTIADMKLLPEEYEGYINYYKFNRHITQKQFEAKRDKNKIWLKAVGFATPFFEQHYVKELVEGKDFEYISGGILFSKSAYNKIYKNKMQILMDYVNTPEFIKQYNLTLLRAKFAEIWNKYCKGSISDWEFDSISYYYNEHPLLNVDKKKYNLTSFSELPEEPIVEEEYYWKDRLCYKYKLSRICGTVLDSDRNKHIISLLTPENEIVSVKFYAGAFFNYNKPIKVVENGKSVTKENSWFTKGNKLLIVGYRSNDMFRPKKYKDSIYRHTVALVENIGSNGLLTLKELRYGEKENYYQSY